MTFSFHPRSRLACLACGERSAVLPASASAAALAASSALRFLRRVRAAAWKVGPSAQDAEKRRAGGKTCGLTTAGSTVAVLPRSFWRSSPGVASRKLPCEMAASSASIFFAATNAATAVAVSTVMVYHECGSRK